MSRAAQSFTLFPQRSAHSLDMQLFANPPREYRGTPFWCWNDRLDRAQLMRQIDVMRRMGFGGFHVHSRTGLADEYLGTTFMNCVALCVDEAKRHDMLCWLYDEDRWPSGYAGGLATRDLQHRQRHLLWTRVPYGQNAPRGKSDYTTAVRNETGRLVARFDVELDAEARLRSYRRVGDHETPSADHIIWHAYIEPATPSTWFNGQTAVDTFSKPAIDAFIRTTHERYTQSIGTHFGTTVPAIFTDEPQFVKKSLFARGDESHDLFMPICEDFFDSFRVTFGTDLADHLPELFWNLSGDAPSQIRYQYHEHTAERFASAFGDTLGEWCDAHSIALTGHMLGEAHLMSQTRGMGEAMRGLRAFQLPGIDILSDKRELTTAKQAQSIAHQFGRDGVVSELYGVTGWHFDFVGHKAQGDWQATLGVVVRVPHLFWMSMRGEAKRDYPASIGEQSPWFDQYDLVETHFARVATTMTRGVPATRVGVIHPIESAWLHWGPTKHNTRAVQRLEETFTQLPEWMLFGHVDFDYISESILASQLPPVIDGGDSTLQVGAMRYGCVIVPPTRTLRSTTLDVLQRFHEAGGDVIFAGDIAECVDAVPSDRVMTFAQRATSLAFEKRALLDRLDRWKDVSITALDESPIDSVLHQLRMDGDRRYLFLVNTDRVKSRRCRIAVRGRWDVDLMDTLQGTSSALPRTLEDDSTIFIHELPAHGHLLIALSPASCLEVLTLPSIKWKEVTRLADPVPITLSEPNVLILDRAQYRLSASDAWSEPTDILRIDNLIRSRVQLPPRTGRGVQPWADRSPAPVLATTQLRYVIHCAAATGPINIGIESPEEATIRLDGRLISNVPIGWWVDQAIARVACPALSAGMHELLIEIPFTRRAELEACYLLGDFGVRVSGAHAVIIEPVRTLAWGDWTTQGLPFYGGNVVYHASVHCNGDRLKLAFPKFANPLLSLDRGGTCIGKVAFAPFELTLDGAAEPFTLDVTAFGNRGNTFGPLHHSDEQLTWVGPNAWRSTGAAWQDAYVLRRMGVLSAPIVYQQEH